MSELDKLRARAEMLHNRATSKISRLKKNGVILSGTNLDPRPNKRNYRKYTKRQLESVILRLERFTERGGATVPLRHGRINEAEYLEFKRLERQRNKQKLEFLNYVKNFDAFGDGSMTVGQAIATVRPDAPRMGHALGDPYMTTDKKSHHIQSPKAFRELLKSVKEKRDSGYVADQVRAIKKSIQGMAEYLDPIQQASAGGERWKFSEEIGKLNDRQLVIAWHTKLAEATASSYHLVLAALGIGAGAGAKLSDRAFNDNIGTFMQSVRGTVESASRLDV